jgi:hypothetical protein
MIERGVRFVQIYHNNWDTHGNVAGRLPSQCKDVDQACYGLIQDQGGQITCYNRAEGGATFRIELPAVPAAFPFPPRGVVAPPRDNPAKLA